MTDGWRAPAELETIADFVRWAASRFEAAGLHYGHGTDNAIDEAAALVLHTLHLPPDLHEAYFPCRLIGEERDAVAARVGERVERRLPLAYITHEGWFLGLPFYVDDRVLVPRSPIAELIEASFVPWLDPSTVTRVADVGTGSGCIAVGCALALPQAQIDALDNSTDALAVTRINAERHGVSERVHSLHSDLLNALPGKRHYQLIVANPPYVDEPAMQALPPEYQHEPHNALAGGESGLDVVHRLLRQAAGHLDKHGVLVCEVGYSWPAMERTYPDLDMTWLALERGGEGVFVVEAEELRRYFAIDR